MHTAGKRTGQQWGDLACLAGLGLTLFAALGGCAAGSAQFAESPAGFWAGLWHGLILLVTFVISLFSDGVAVYEPANSGAMYNLGFLLGVAIFFGSCGRGHGESKRRKAKQGQRAKEQEWAEIGEGMEERIRRGIKSWLSEASHDEKEWEETAAKLEKKILRELRKWADG